MNVRIYISSVVSIHKLVSAPVACTVCRYSYFLTQLFTTECTMNVVINHSTSILFIITKLLSYNRYYCALSARFETYYFELVGRIRFYVYSNVMFNISCFTLSHSSQGRKIFLSKYCLIYWWVSVERLINPLILVRLHWIVLNVSYKIFYAVEMGSAGRH